MIKIFLFFFIQVLILNASTFSQSKKILLKDIYFDNQNTFYCNNPYEIKKVNNKYKALIIKDDNYYTPRKPFSKSGVETHELGHTNA